MESSKTVYLVRHGQTDYNLKSIVQGRGVNSSLNATGRQQAAAFYAAYRHIPFDKLYTSTLVRTHQTMEAFRRDGIPYEAVSAIDEIDWGIYEGVEHDPQMHERYLSIIERWRRNETGIRIDGGESAADLWDRVVPFVNSLKASAHSTILVCSHGRTIRALLCAMTGRSLHLMDDFPHNNTSLYKLLYNDGSFEIELFNNTDHLNGSL